MLFPFGHGLTYSEFDYSNLMLSKAKLTDQETVTVTLDVTNIGDRSAKEVIQLYVADKQTDISRPELELKGFDKLELEAGETKSVSFKLDKRSFAFL